MSRFFFPREKPYQPTALGFQSTIRMPWPSRAARLRLPPRPMLSIPIINTEILRLPRQVIDPEVLRHPNRSCPASSLLLCSPCTHRSILGYPHTTSPNIAAAAHVCSLCCCTSNCSSRSASRPCPLTPSTTTVEWVTARYVVWRRAEEPRRKRAPDTKAAAHCSDCHNRTKH